MGKSIVSLSKKTRYGTFPIFLKKLSLFFVLTLPLLYAINRYLGKKLEVEFHPLLKIKYNEAVRSGRGANVIVMGSSNAETGINPKQLEKIFPRVFNFGIPGANPEFVKEWYRRIFRIHYRKPELIIFVIDPATVLNVKLFEQDSFFFPPLIFIECWSIALLMTKYFFLPS